MGTPRIRFDFEIKGLKQLNRKKGIFKRMAGDIQKAVKKRIRKDAGQFRDRVRRKIRSGGAGLGWPPLSPVTLKIRRNRTENPSFRTTPRMDTRGTLRAIQVMESTAGRDSQRVMVGIPAGVKTPRGKDVAFLFAYHEFGTFGHGNSFRSTYVTRKMAFKFRQNFQVFKSIGDFINVPARPVLGPVFENLQEEFINNFRQAANRIVENAADKLPSPVRKGKIDVPAVKWRTRFRRRAFQVTF